MPGKIRKLENDPFIRMIVLEDRVRRLQKMSKKVGKDLVRLDRKIKKVKSKSEVRTK